MAEVASPLRPYASRFAIEPTKSSESLLERNWPAGFLEIGDTCDLGALYLRLIAEVHEVRIFIAEKECHGIGRHRGTDNSAQRSARRPCCPRRSRDLFRRLGAFSRHQFSADYTIGMFGFDFRQGQASKMPLFGCHPESACAYKRWDRVVPTKPAKLAKPAANGGNPWVVSDTSFPAGSEFMAEHKGKTYSGIINDGKFELSDGGEFTTPSAAAVHVTGSRVNGWRFWKCKLPGASQFVLIERLRGKVH